jgi:hypothetical protein
MTALPLSFASGGGGRTSLFASYRSAGGDGDVWGGGDPWSTEPCLRMFDNVVLTTDYAAEGEILSRGASGTIVDIFGGGTAFAVEFFEPRHCIMTVHRAALTLDRP